MLREFQWTMEKILQTELCQWVWRQGGFVDHHRLLPWHYGLNVCVEAPTSNRVVFASQGFGR